MNSLVGKEVPNIKIRIDSRLGAGAFGDIYKASSIQGNSKYAVKVQPANTKTPQLFFQAKLLTYLNNDPQLDKGIPTSYFCTTFNQKNLMVMDLLGDSLQNLFNNCDRKFDLWTTAFLGKQMLQRVKYIHSKHVIHRDIKPDNFMVGLGKRSRKVYMIDFGLAKMYMRKGKHITYKDNKSFIGTARYASVNTHMGIEQSCRDDIQSLGYVLIYFLRGTLPWQNIKVNTKKDKFQRIMEKKISTSMETLCGDLPPIFRRIITSARQLDFQAKPSYHQLSEGLEKLLQEQSRPCWQKKNV